MKLIGIDVGYSAVKALDGEKSCLFPSVVGTPVPQATFAIRRDQKALAVSGNGHYTPVGETALLQSRYVSGRRDPDWVLGQEWLALFETALSEFCTAPLTQVKLVTGLPVGDWNQFEEQLRGKLQQTFAFRRVWREQQRVEVKDVIVVTQPYGALLDMALGKEGQILHNEWSESRVGIVDIGGNTMNLLAVKAFEEITHLTVSDQFGLLHALDEVRDHLKRSFSRFSPETHEVSEWLALGSFRHGGKDYDIWPYAEPYLSPLIDLVMVKLNDVWPESGRFDAVLLSGGGAAVLGRYLKSRMAGTFANVAIGADPRWANVRGYHKLALREFANA